MKIKIKALSMDGRKAIERMKKDYDWKARLVMRCEFPHEEEVVISPIFKNGFGATVVRLPVDELQRETEKRWVETMRQYGCSRQDYSLEVLNNG